MAMMSGAWKEMTTFPTSQKYESPKQKLGIWRDKVTRGHRESRVTDRELRSKRDSTASDCFGNVLSENMSAADMARVTIERALCLLAPAVQRKITAKAKWDAIDLLAAGQKDKALATLRACVV